MPISQNLWVQPGAEDAAVTYVSNLYPIMGLELVDIIHNILEGDLVTWLPGNVDITHAMVSGVLSQLLKTYSNGLPEGADVVHAYVSGTLTQVLRTYSNWPPELVDVVHNFISGSLTQVLFYYTNWPVESANVTHNFVSGSLT